ncbi:SDR family oxidoreductase [Sphingobium sp. HWE2-09]|uniref:SDR family oxidoreductase n=1 Tax=Sphingobium sp. HWE2-09 TaxID=3108390 RepID=UPI002DCE8E4E|nr:SDR family NAD(P)-dependent oxidoreductase [Sphingobium sp. HWE2-09]
MSEFIMIIGAGPGIGQAVARKFGREGWQIVLTGRSAARLADLTAELEADGITAHAVPADATDPAALRVAVAKALTGGLTAVHFNAGVVRNQDLFSMTDAEIASDIAIDVTAGINTIRAATESFGSRGGTILVTGGGLGVHPSADWAVLGAGKTWCRGLLNHWPNRASASASRPSRRWSAPVRTKPTARPMSSGPSPTIRTPPGRRSIRPPEPRLRRPRQRPQGARRPDPQGRRCDRLCAPPPQ